MDWPQADFDWNLVRAFLATAEEGSYSAAAKVLRLAQPTIGRQVALLEQQLGVALFERAGRGVALTPTGLELVEHVRTMSESALKLSRVAAGQSLALEGPITLSASEVDAAVHLAPLVPKLRALVPGLEVELIASNEAQDLRRREADIALRGFRPSEPELIARRVRDSHACLYASTAWLRAFGKVTKRSLSGATFVGFDRSDTLRRGLAALGLELTADNFPILTRSQHTQWALVKAGAGIGIMTTEVGDREPGVQRVLKELPPITIPMWLVTHREVHTSRRVRVVADFLFSALGGARDEGELVWTSSGRGKGSVNRRRQGSS